MPHPHRYRLKADDAEAIQVNPSFQTKELEEFCPSLTFNEKTVYGADRGNGLVYPPDSDRPYQEFPDRPFFWIRSRGCWIRGDAWDWIVRFPDGEYEIRSEADFAKLYEAV